MQRSRPKPRFDIAVVGIGYLVPGARGLAQLERSLETARTAFGPFPSRRWWYDRYWSFGASGPEMPQELRGAFLEGFEFPFIDYRLPPKQLQGVDVAQLVALEATRDALADAGIAWRADELTDAVTVFGTGGVDAYAHAAAYLDRHDFAQRVFDRLRRRGVDDETLERLDVAFAEELDRRHHLFDPKYTPIGAIPSSISNRVAQVFGIRGYNMTIDAAGASSLAALETACYALMAGDARLAITGGVDLEMNPSVIAGMAAMGRLSRSGRSRPFDAGADGALPGEGAAVFVLERLEDALSDGRRVHAVIRGVGSSNAGAGQRDHLPMTEGRVETMRRGLEAAGVRADDVQLLMAYALSTPRGDAVELDAASRVHGGRGDAEPLRLASVARRLGDLRAATGAVALAEAIVAMERGVYPHQPDFDVLNPRASAPSTALRVPTEPEPWTPLHDGRRIAAVTTAGLGGTGHHVVLERAPSYDVRPGRDVPSRRVAIVAAAIRVADADDVETFWANIKEGRESFVEIDAREVGWRYHQDWGPERERISTRRAALLEPRSIDRRSLGVEPAELTWISPSQELALEVGERLFADAPRPLSTARIGASLGAMHDDHFAPSWSVIFIGDERDAMLTAGRALGLEGAALDRAVEGVVADLRRERPRFDRHALPGRASSMIPGRLAKRHDLRGPCLTVDTACSSGLAALVPATYQLMFGDVDLMISGGLNRQLETTFTCNIGSLGAVAERLARPFDARGEGFLIGEGGVLLLLERLDDALDSGHEVLAVLDAVHGSSEADTKSMVAPTKPAMTRSIRNALARSSVDPGAIDIVDAHGTANLASDVVEASALAEVLRPGGGGQRPVQISTVKSHLGHLYGGSGALSLLSTVLSLRDSTAPGIRNLENLRPEVAPLLGQIEPRRETRRLTPRAEAGGVNSLGIGGANYFAILRRLRDDEEARLRSRPTPPSSARSLDDVFDSAFLTYLKEEEPAILALLSEAHERFLAKTES